MHGGILSNDLCLWLLVLERPVGFIRSEQMDSGKRVVISDIECWIERTNTENIANRQSCEVFASEFNGFYTKDFLRSAYFVLVDDVPKPDLPSVREAGLGDFLDMPSDGITYKDTYYIKSDHKDDLVLHFHELVHVTQWKLLGASNFLERYIHEINSVGYDDAPLEKMAYFLGGVYEDKNEVIDVNRYVKKSLRG